MDTKLLDRIYGLFSIKEDKFIEMVIDLFRDEMIDRGYYTPGGDLRLDKSINSIRGFIFSPESDNLISHLVDTVHLIIKDPANWDITAIERQFSVNAFEMNPDIIYVHIINTGFVEHVVRDVLARPICELAHDTKAA